MVLSVPGLVDLPRQSVSLNQKLKFNIPPIQSHLLWFLCFILPVHQSQINCSGNKRFKQKSGPELLFGPPSREEAAGKSSMIVQSWRFRRQRIGREFDWAQNYVDPSALARLLSGFVPCPPHMLCINSPF